MRETEASAPSVNPAETNRVKEALQTLGALVSLDNTFISFNKSDNKAYKIGRGTDMNLALTGVGNSQGRMTGLQMKGSTLTVTYANGTISKFHIGTNPPAPEKLPEGPTLVALQNIISNQPGNVLQNYNVALKNKKTLVINPQEPRQALTLKALIIRNDKG